MPAAPARAKLDEDDVAETRAKVRAAKPKHNSYV
jgi:hypothetical protein